MRHPPESYADAPLASREVRMAAFLLDSAAQMGVPLLAGLYSFWLSGEGLTVTWTSTIFFLALAMLNVYLLTSFGQSLGKMALGTKIVLSATGENGGFFPNVLLRNVVTNLLNLVPGFSPVNVLFILRKDRRCVHDWIAGTRVVQAKPPQLGAARIVNATAAGALAIALLSISGAGIAEHGVRHTLTRWEMSWRAARAERTVDRAEREYGFRHPIVAWRLGQLADLYDAERRDDEAVKTWNRGMRMFADAGSLYSNWTAMYSQEIAWVLLTRGQHDEAMTNLLYALQLHEGRVSWPDWPQVDEREDRVETSLIGSPPGFMYLYPDCLTLIGRVLVERGEDVEAESYYRRAIEVLQRSLLTSMEDASAAIAAHVDPLVGLAGVLLRRMRYTDAKELLDRAWELAEQLDPMDPSVAEVLRARAEYYAVKGDTRQAISDAQRAVEIVRSFGDTQPDIRRFEDTLRQVKGGRE